MGKTTTCNEGTGPELKSLSRLENKKRFLRTCLLEHCTSSVTRPDFAVEDEMYLYIRALPDFGVTDMGNTRVQGHGLQLQGEVAISRDRGQPGGWSLFLRGQEK